MEEVRDALENASADCDWNCRVPGYARSPANVPCSSGGSTPRRQSVDELCQERQRRGTEEFVKGPAAVPTPGSSIATDGLSGERPTHQCV